MNSELQRRVIKARIALLMTNPFFGTVAMALDIVEDDTADATAWTDGLQLGFSPSFVEGLDDRALIGLIAHEVMHVSDQHHLRRGARDPDRWNEACDFAINGITADGDAATLGSGAFGERGSCEKPIGSYTPANLTSSAMDPKQNCGNYFNAPDQDGLNKVFDEIASRMFTRITR